MPSLSEKQHGDQARAVSSADADRFLSLIDTHQRLLLKVCWTYTRNSHDRDDLLQEIVSRLWASFRGYDESRTFSTWMYRVALNVAIDFYRRRHRREGKSLIIDDANEPRVAFDEDKQEQLQELRELMEQLSEGDRAILLLCLEGNSYREIAEIIGISESNVGTRLSRLKKSLRQSVDTSNR